MQKQKEKHTRTKIGRVGEAVLHGAAAVGVVSIAIFAPNMLKILAPLLKDKKYSPKQALDRNVDSLVKAGFLKRTHTAGGQSQLALTPKGKWEAFIRHGKTEQKQKKWDGFWRIIIFDVPNEKGNIRSELRRAMKLYGFHALQKSVWVYPYPCDAFVALIKSHLGVAEDMLLIKAVSIENDKHLRSEFKL